MFNGLSLQYLTPKYHVTGLLGRRNSRDLIQDNLPAPVLPHPHNGSAKVSATERLTAQHSFEKNQKINYARVSVHAYLSVSHLKRFVLERAGFKIRDLFFFCVQLTVAVNNRGIIGIVLLVKASISLQLCLDF